MKDYYYILGLGKEATLPEIQQAYKKLALKFHPDENGGDPFFAMHYAKIQEAYKVLSDEHSRYRYDKSLLKDIPEVKTKIVEGPAPVISSFFASKKALKKGDLLTISWEVLNADEVRISLIGEVASNGTQTIRLTEELLMDAFLVIEIHASNKNSTKKSSKELIIKNLEEELPSEGLKNRLHAISKKNTAKEKTIAPKPNKINPSHVEDEDEEDEVVEKKKTKPKSQPKIERPNQNGAGTAYLLVATMIFIIFFLLYILHSINPMF